MKKILTIIIALTLVLVMTGCDENNVCYNDYGLAYDCDNVLEQHIYYTQEEVDAIIDEELEDFAQEVIEALDKIDVRFDTYYTQDQIDELFRLAGVEQSIADLYVLAMVEDDFYTKAEMTVYINELEQRIEILEGEQT